LNLDYSETFIDHKSPNLIVKNESKIRKDAYIEAFWKEGYAGWAWQTIRRKPDKRAKRWK